ncbi:MAG: 4-hydroxy-tetrahydrodipicolinate reductase [Kiritimatiellae bacterium]|nr:4-hydroxy-tetrahydrodipicolinate reductase [Kiritimatiellia bacterium]MBR3921799.1 4-hydroxy-tetrahydrodipicolinate reductase [Kiritimatiellia bacterium]
MKVAILGAAGRMGHMLCDLVDRSEELELVAKCDVREDYPRTWPAGTEAVIDFTFHEAVPANITKAAKEGVVYVLGTTGLTDEEQQSVEAAAKKIPVVQSGNYSLGVNLLLGLVKKAAEVLGIEYDCEVVETHHRHKKDSPSGTALMLARAAAEGRNQNFDDVSVFGREGMVGERPQGEIAVHAIRGGSVIGDHTVMFAGDVERIEITHKAQTREAFAAGALRAALWAADKKPGIYNMRDVLGL